MERKELWKCPECTSKRPKKGNTNTPVRCSTQIPDEIEPEPCSHIGSHVTKYDSNVTQRSKNIRSSPPSDKSDISAETDDTSARTYNVALFDDLKRYFRELLLSQVESLKESIDTLTTTISAHNSRLELLEAKVATLEGKMEEAHSTPSTESIVLQLQSDIAERDQAMLSNDLEIASFPEGANENCSQIIISVAKKIGVEIGEEDIVSAERAGPPRPATQQGAPVWPRPIAVRLVRRATRDALLHAARTRRDLNTDGIKPLGPTNRIYVNERLTKYNRVLLKKTRAMALELQHKFVWTRDGKIFVRQSEGKPRHRIRNEMDLTRVFGKAITN